MRKYSDEQLRAINTISTHTAVIAGAGTGKTSVLIERLKKIIESGVSKSDILAITFTKKAANEMKERLNIDEVQILTFDAFCYALVKDTHSINMFTSSKEFSKQELLSFNIYDANYKTEKKPKGYSKYREYKIRHKLYDFNDIEYLALKIIKQQGISYKYILVDEFQDTNNLQYEIFASLINNNTNTFIVGDPDQSIYKFRGANNKLINRYIDKFKAEVNILTNNYRSSRNIITYANMSISNNIKRINKILVPNSLNNGTVKILLFNNENIEYNYIIKICNQCTSKKYSIAILFRNHEQGYLYKRYYYNSYFKISIMSIHESKGLEFDVVFIIGVNKGVFPQSFNVDLDTLEEERRLFFVAITRAKKELYISSNDKVSKFVREIKRKKMIK